MFLSGIEVDTVIGAHDWEREIRQTLVIDVEIACDIARAAKTDAISDLAVDYSAVALRIKEWVEASQFHLIESLAEQLASMLLSEFGLEGLKLTVQKPRPQSGYSAGVIIERS